MRTSNLIKYQSDNPIQRLLIQRFFDKVVWLLKGKKISKIADIGCGEGFGLDNLAKNKIGQSYIGLDSSAVALREAKNIHPQFKYVKGSIYQIPFKNNQFDLVICSEVLEHLNNPEKAIQELKRISHRYVLISVPFEPWFRIMNLLRGKYLKSWGNHPEHINWWGMSGLKSLLGPELKILRHEVTLPWQIVLCEVEKKGLK